MDTFRKYKIQRNFKKLLEGVPKVSLAFFAEML